MSLEKSALSGGDLSQSQAVMRSLISKRGKKGDRIFRRKRRGWCPRVGGFIMLSFRALWAKSSWSSRIIGSGLFFSSFWVLGSSWCRGLCVDLVLRSHATNIKPEYEQNAVFHRRLCVPLRLKVLAGRCCPLVKRSQYLGQPLNLGEIGRTFFPPQIKAKRYGLALSMGIVKEVLHKLITVKNLISVGMEAKREWGFGTVEWQGILVQRTMRPWALSSIVGLMLYGWSNRDKWLISLKLGLVLSGM